MVREGDVLRRRHVGEIGQRLLDLGADLEPLRRGDGERGRRTGDDDQPDGDPAGEPARQRPAAGFLAGAGLRRRLVRARERLGVAARLAPRPPVVRPVGLRGAKAFGVAEPQRLDAEPFRLVEVGLGEGERSRTGLLVRQVQDRQAPVLVQRHGRDALLPARRGRAPKRDDLVRPDVPGHGSPRTAVQPTTSGPAASRAAVRTPPARSARPRARPAPR